MDKEGVDESVQRRLFEVPRQETLNLARLGVLNQFLGQSETDGSIRNGNDINLADLRSVDACLTAIKLRYCRERYDRLVRGLLSRPCEANDEQRACHDLRHANVQRREFRS